MVVAVQVLEPLAGDVGIDLGGTEIAMTQQKLHDA
jgi:hypothetical protein